MPMPMQYRRASADFDAFMIALRDRSGLTTTHQTYTTLQAVLQVFRRRLSIAEAIAFAQILPPVLRAIFVSDWDIEEQRLPFAPRESLVDEVRALRPDHNFSPDSAIADVAVTLRAFVDAADFDRALGQLPPQAQAFWAA